MSNNQLPASVQERIKADAERFTKDEGYQKVYIAGATAERINAQQLIDRRGIALENIYNIHSEQWSEFDRNEIKGILQQWKKGKEVGNG